MSQNSPRGSDRSGYVAFVILGNREVRRRPAHLVLAALACALVALAAIPALASAASQTFVVNGTGDGTNKDECETSITTDECTLRGAIEAANATSEADTITFDAGVFGGAAPASTISIAEGLPKIEAPLTIDGGGECTTVFGKGPCAEINSGAGEPVFAVGAASTTIENLAVNGGEDGIVVEPGTKGFKATGDWFGVELKFGSGGGQSNSGILLEAGAEEATIGGTVAASRNVFGEGDVGVEINGASKNKVEGNFLGVNPEGIFTAFHSLSIGVRVLDQTASPAKGNEIGGPRSAAKSAECSGACNVIATNQGEGVALLSATGPTSVRGNYLGLSQVGTTKIGTSSAGIVAEAAGTGDPGPGEVTIGGPSLATESNFFVGGEYGVRAFNAKGLTVIANFFGYTSAHKTIDEGGAGSAAVSVSSSAQSGGASIFANSINAATAVGVESTGHGSEIAGNQIASPAYGIEAYEDDGGIGNGIFGNTITGAEAVAVYVENDNNVLSGNTITNAQRAGIEIEGEDVDHQIESNVVIANTISKVAGAGIVVGSNATHNRIGGDEGGEANTIVESGAAEPTNSPFGAIVIVSRQEGRNEVAANTGSGNRNAFIQLVSHGGAEEPNGGIKPPTLGTVQQSSAAGTAQPNATVRVFSKASSEPGELGELLAVVKADGAGNWTATYDTQAVSTLLTATQTSDAGTPEAATSELAAPIGAAADPVKPDEPTGGGSTPPAPLVTAPVVPPPPPAAKAPKVKITSGPKKSSDRDHGEVQVQGRTGRRGEVRVQARRRQMGQLQVAEDLQGAEAGQAHLPRPREGERPHRASRKFQFVTKP